MDPLQATNLSHYTPNVFRCVLDGGAAGVQRPCKFTKLPWLL